VRVGFLGQSASSNTRDFFPRRPGAQVIRRQEKPWASRRPWRQCPARKTPRETWTPGRRAKKNCPVAAPKPQPLVVLFFFLANAERT
jgi:hypothetical protein